MFPLNIARNMSSLILGGLVCFSAASITSASSNELKPSKPEIYSIAAAKSLRTGRVDVTVVFAKAVTHPKSPLILTEVKVGNSVCRAPKSVTRCTVKNVLAGRKLNVSARAQNRNGFGASSAGIPFTPKAGIKWTRKVPESVATTPVTTSPVVASPVVTSPVVTSPVVASPVVTSPVVTSPDVPVPSPQCVVVPSNTGNLSTDFVMTVNTCYSIDNTLTLPLRGTFVLTVDWGDGSQGSFANSGNQNPTHTYSREGIYTIQIRGNLQHFGVLMGGVDSWPGSNMVTTVNSFGSLGLTSLEGAFCGASNLSEVPTSLPTSVTSLAGMFFGADLFDQDIGSWNVSNVTNMSMMFFLAHRFNGNIGSWDVSRVTNMERMFYDTPTFNQDLNGWATSAVTNMSGMFLGSNWFNGVISNWNVSNVTDMQSMFGGAFEFSGDISGWNVSKVTNMAGMFAGAMSFNGNLSGWNVSRVTYMVGMFRGATNFNGNLSGWNVSSLEPISQVSRTHEVFTGTRLEGREPLWHTNWDAWYSNWVASRP